MFSSEQKLSINGDRPEDLKLAIEFVLKFADENVCSIYKHPVKGIIFGWLDENKHGFEKVPFELNPTLITDIVLQYLESKEVKNTYKKLQDRNDKDGLFINGCDGSIYEGWEIFIPVSEHQNKKYGIEEPFYATFGVRPTLTFYGK